MIQKSMQIQLANGLEARPVAVLVQKASMFDSKIYIEAEGKKVNAKTRFDAYKSGDETASKVVDEYIANLAAGIVNLINIFQPEVLCIGGGVSNERQFLIDLLMPYITTEDFAKNARERTKIVIAKFRNDAGIIGAAMVGVKND